MSCAIERCDDPDCQVCTTIERGFVRATFKDMREMQMSSHPRPKPKPKPKPRESLWTR